MLFVGYNVPRRWCLFWDTKKLFWDTKKLFLGYKKLFWGIQKTFFGFQNAFSENNIFLVDQKYQNIKQITTKSKIIENKLKRRRKIRKSKRFFDFLNLFFVFLV